jgi:transposase
MRGRGENGDGLFSYVPLEKRIPTDHPLRAIRALADAALAKLSQRFEALYSCTGRPSIPPETLLRATLLQAFFSVRSERQLMEQIDYNLLFRWFVGLPMDAAVWHPTTFTHNRDRLLESDVARAFLASLLSLPQV